MQIKLYKNSAEKSRLNKTSYITLYKTITGTLRSECSMIDPVIQVQSTEPISANYAYIEEFSRYYFIDDIISIRLNVWELHMSVDVLMSFRTEIEALPCSVNRTADVSFQDKDIVDNLLPKINKGSIVEHYFNMTDQYDLFGNPFDYRLLESSRVIFVIISSALGYTDYTEFSGRYVKNIFNIPASSESPDANCLTCYMFDFSNQNGISNWAKFNQQVLFDTEKSSYIVGMYIAPLYIPPKDTTNRTWLKNLEDVSSIQVGKDDPIGFTSPNSGIYRVPLYDNYFKNIIEINTHYSDFRRFSPYSSYELYLPFYGWIDIDDKIFAKNSKAYLFIGSILDYTTFTMQYAVGVQYMPDEEGGADVDCVLIGYYEAQFGCPIPINKSDVNEVNSKYQRSALSFIGSSVSALGSAARLYGMTNAGGLLSFGVGFGTDLFNAGMHTMGEVATNIPRGEVKNVNSIYNSYSSVINKYIFREKYVDLSNSFDDDIYNSLYGKPCGGEVEALSMLSGYTVVSECHVEDISTATGNELDKIYSQLKSGIII